MVGFDWDEANKLKNWIRHRVKAKECEELFFNEPLYIFEDKEHSQTEDRYIALGQTNKARRLHLVFTIRKDKIRVISARDQNKKERKYYKQTKKTIK